ncbi:MAG: translation elongation factor 4, partial [Dehalococcoidia bacterium]|nr:translation elongation factor 4 [Dehalococcoidia bacterium]
MDASLIRNFSIIAHIDHGKSTLADRILEKTGVVDHREMQQQFLDSMDLEREKGITIKAQAVRMHFHDRNDRTFELNLIDTPGHVDFAYEVSRALAACEGALLIVDATQGIQAQTLANVYQALNMNLTLIPIVNKIDLPSAEPERVALELIDVIGFDPDEILFASGKTGEGVEEILQTIVDKIPSPEGNQAQALRALVFDAKYDAYKGVLIYLRVVEGMISGKETLKLLQQGRSFDPIELGYFSPDLKTTDSLMAGQVGYVATGLKGVQDSRVGDTLTTARNSAQNPLAGYKPAQAMVFAGLYPTDPEQYPELREALERLSLNDASLQWQPETSGALGFGFRCGFLGLLHMEIIEERLEREFDLELIATAPSVEYEVVSKDGSVLLIDSPAKLPVPNQIDE